VNDSLIHNEFLSHRLSLVPLCFSEEEINVYQKFDYKFVIDVENIKPIPIDVTTKDIEIYDDMGKKVDKEMRDRIFPSDPFTKDHILITILPGGNEKNRKKLHVEAYATEGIARKNACWSCVSQCSYKYKMDEKKAQEALEKLLEEKKTNNDNVDIEWETKVFYTMDAKRYYHVNKNDDPNIFEFVIHSECALTIQYILSKTFDIMISKTKRFKDFLLSNDENIGTINIDDKSGIANITILKETYSFGNLVQSYTYNIHVNKSKELEYIGFTCPHPLQNSMILRMKAHSNGVKLNIKQVRNLLESVCDAIIDDAKSLSQNIKKHV
jgi:DNA-directed RNA polymerase subunit L